VNGRQAAAINHLKIVGRDVHRYASYAIEYGLTPDQIKEAIADGVNAAAREEEPWHGTEQASDSTCGPMPIGAH
jgi:hypothetical protein